MILMGMIELCKGVTMNSLKTSILALGLMAAVAGQAQAADPTPDSYAAMGFYLRGDIGWSFLEWGGQDDSAFTAGGGIGYQVDDQIRADLRLDWAGDYRIAPGADMSVSTVLANMYFDIPTDTVMTPYLGAGAGYGLGSIEGLNDKNGFAFALMAGVNMSVTESVDVDVGYRFREVMSNGDDPMEHQITTGLRFKF
jgi:opacity protein-like surface antigen